MSAIKPLYVAIDTAIQSDAELPSLLSSVPGERVYNAGSVPAGAKLPYIVLGEPTENGANLFRRRGYSNTVTLHIWAASQQSVLDIYEHLERLLTVRLTLPDHTTAKGKTSLVTILPDPQVKVEHGVVQYEVRTLVR